MFDQEKSEPTIALGQMWEFCPPELRDDSLD